MVRAGFLALILAAGGTCTDGQEKNLPVTGEAHPDLASFDNLMLKFVAENQVPGAALAVAKGDKLVYARGFGHADPELGLPVKYGMRFRIASISKPITAAMILQLIELGLLRLEDNPFEVLKIALPAEADQRLKKITIKHLMQHTAGWDRAVSFDPMFRPVLIAKEQKAAPPAKPMDIIHYMTRQKLDFDPGTRYAYSNFGYCILGRVIEKVTGQKFDVAVQKHIFDPVGIKNTQLGQTLTTAKNEVKYFDEKKRKGNAIMGPHFGKPVTLPYGAWYLEAMDSHGGYISSAPDLVRFATAFNEPGRLLKADAIQTMFAKPAGLPDPKDEKLKGVHYGCGWMVREVGGGAINTWHTGSLDGTSTILVRRHDGLSWAVLFNTRKNAKGETLSTLIDPLVHVAADQVKRWPDRDIFKKGQ